MKTLVNFSGDLTGKKTVVNFLWWILEMGDYGVFIIKNTPKFNL